MILSGQRTIGIAAALLAAIACGTARPGPPATPEGRPGTVPDLQRDFEAGRYEAVVAQVRQTPAPPEGHFLAGKSLQRLERPGEAEAEFVRLSQLDSEAWQITGGLAVALIRGDQATGQRLSARANQYPSHPFVQFELGQWLGARGRWAEAAEAFDRAGEADPSFAYAFYYAGLAYSRVQRPDRMAARFEAFLRLAPNAPERPEVESVLRTLRG